MELGKLSQQLSWASAALRNLNLPSKPRQAHTRLNCLSPDPRKDPRWPLWKHANDNYINHCMNTGKCYICKRKNHHWTQCYTLTKPQQSNPQPPRMQSHSPSPTWSPTRPSSPKF
eukprot:scaffold101997_cov19-Tisochrysis_lutea.AAC.1